MAADSTFVIYESNLGDIVRSMQPDGLHAGLRQIPIRFSVTMPEALRQHFRTNSLLNNDVQLRLGNAVRAVVQRDLFPGINDNSRADAALRARVDQAMRRATPALTSIVADAIRTSMQTSAAWRDYRSDSAKEIARISLTLAAAGIAAAIVPPTVGASIGLLIVTLVRGVTDASKKFSESYRSAEESRLRVIAEIERLEKAYRHGRSVGRASQIGGAVAHALTVGKIATVFGSDPVPGFTRIKGELNAYKGKLGHLNRHAERLGGQLYQLLDAIHAYREERNIPVEGEYGHPALLDLERKVSMLLVGGMTGKRHGFRGAMNISDAWTRSHNGLLALADLETKFTALKAKEEHGNAVLIADRTVTLLTNLGVALAGYHAPLSVAGGSATQVQAAMRIDPANPAWQRGAGALALGFFRQFMSLFKDTHALAKELGVVTSQPDGTAALSDRVAGEFAGVALPPPRMSPAGADLVRTLEARYAVPSAAAPPAPTRAPPPPPPMRAPPPPPPGRAPPPPPPRRAPPPIPSRP